MPVMIKFALPLALFSILAMGCGRAPEPPPRPGGVAVIDLDDVAKRLGRDVSISSELKGAGDLLSTKLGETQKGYQSELEKSRAALPETLSDEDNQKLLQLSQSLNQQFQSKQREAQEELNATRLALVNRFKEEVKPVAKKIALSRGLEVVILKSELILTALETVDITDEVVVTMVAYGKGSPTPVPVATPKPTSTPSPSPSAAP